MNEISIAVRYNNDMRTVSGRELHKVLNVRTQYSMWFDRMREYGFIENTDFFTVTKNVYREDGRPMPQKQIDHNLTIDMAKELCMIQRTEIGNRCRKYFLNLERQWNSPDAVMARALQIADQKLELANQQNNNLIETTAVQAKTDRSHEAESRLLRYGTALRRAYAHKYHCEGLRQVGNMAEQVASRTRYPV